MFKKRMKKQKEYETKVNMTAMSFHSRWKEILVDIKRKAAINVTKRLTLEREMFLYGKKPKPIFSSTQQKTAVQLLFGFFGMMLLFTILSRLATDLTIAKVRTDTVKAGVLVQTYSIHGTLEARDTLDIVLPGNLRISNVMVQAGDCVKMGDEILQLDLAHIWTVTEQLENEIDILNLKIENLSNEIPSTDTEMLQLAENNLRYAKENYIQLVEALEVAGTQVKKDLKDAHNKYDQELIELEKAKTQAKEEKIETAENNLNAAEKALEDAEYSRTEAVSTAEKVLSEAEILYSSAKDTYARTSRELTQVEKMLQEAEDVLASLGKDASEEEYAAAQESVNTAHSQKNLAQVQVDTAAGNLSEAKSTLAWAHENLDRILERQNQLVSEAENDVWEAEDTLNETKEQTDFSNEPLVSTALANVDVAQSELNMSMREWENANLSKEEQIINAQRAIETATIELEAAKEQLEKTNQSEAVTRRQNEVEQMQYENELRQKQGILEQIKLFGMQDGVITAPVDGTVKSVNEVFITQDNGSILTLSRADQRFQFTANVEQKTAGQLSAGDTGQLFYTIGGITQSIQVQISSIGVPNKDGQVQVIAWLENGTFSSGIAGTLELEKSSGRYQAVLPVSALRVVGGKTVVLVVREKQSVLGTEQTIEEIDVVIKEQNMESAAVEGGFFPDDQIVIQTSKPIGKGDRVRVEN